MKPPAVLFWLGLAILLPYLILCVALVLVTWGYLLVCLSEGSWGPAAAFLFQFVLSTAMTTSVALSALKPLPVARHYAD